MTDISQTIQTRSGFKKASLNDKIKTVLGIATLAAIGATAVEDILTSDRMSAACSSLQENFNTSSAKIESILPAGTPFTREVETLDIPFLQRNYGGFLFITAETCKVTTSKLVFDNN